MIVRNRISKRDLQSGYKRVSLAMQISDYRKLQELAQQNNVMKPGSLALSYVVERIKADYRSGELPGQQNLFDVVKPKRKGKK